MKAYEIIKLVRYI